ncbi:Nitroreductase-like protein [Aspergillus pseudoustus]|uniref:Nitroreductase-like protein n=1 Tax=Aspergillus pseudoustus TaxID=1810923 RepID=A0ABR4JMJ7_9EURO
MASPIVTISFSEATQKRRSIRALKPQTTVPDSVIVQLAEAALLTKLWSVITADTLRERIGEDRWNAAGTAGLASTRERIANTANTAYGTILFWDDLSTTEEWVQQSNGMHQYCLWTALSALGLGVNVKHYNPLIDARVRGMWNVSAHWKLGAQMVFGRPSRGGDGALRGEDAEASLGAEDAGLWGGWGQQSSLN